MEGETRKWALEPMQEFRFEADSLNKITIKLSTGKAEIFGTELATGVEYHFKAKKLAIFTWHGCNIESSGINVVEYIGKETQMNSILNVHFALQKSRQDASQSGTTGPRVMIVGPSDVGKTCLTKTRFFINGSSSSPTCFHLPKTFQIPSFGRQKCESKFDTFGGFAQFSSASFKSSTCMVSGIAFLSTNIPSKL